MIANKHLKIRSIIDHSFNEFQKGDEIDETIVNEKLLSRLIRTGQISKVLQSESNKIMPEKKKSVKKAVKK